MDMSLTQRELFILTYALMKARNDMPDDVSNDEVETLITKLRNTWTLR